MASFSSCIRRSIGRKIHPTKHVAINPRHGTARASSGEGGGRGIDKKKKKKKAHVENDDRDGDPEIWWSGRVVTPSVLADQRRMGRGYA